MEEKKNTYHSPKKKQLIHPLIKQTTKTTNKAEKPKFKGTYIYVTLHISYIIEYE